MLGISSYPGDANSWWSASGTPIGRPGIDIVKSRFRVNPPPTHQIVLVDRKSRILVLALCNLVGVTGGTAGPSSIISKFGGNPPGGDMHLIVFTPQPDAKTVTLEVMIAEFYWKLPS